MIDTLTIFELLGEGVVAVSIWAALWHIDRRLVRIERDFAHLEEKETDNE